MKSTFIVLVVAAVLLGAHANSIGRRSSKTRSEKVSKAPYHAHLWVSDPYMYKWPASGVLISARHVLTAAININNYNRWDIGLGSDQRRSLKYVTSFYAYVHEEFDDNTDDNNLGIIVMPEPVEFTAHIAPLALPQQNQLVPAEGQSANIAAFAYVTDKGPLSSKLQLGKQLVVSAEECERIYPHLHGIVQHYFCAKDDKYNVCGGAQGAGLTVKQDGQDLLAGIVSFGNIWTNCSEHVAPGFIRIAQYADWISHKLTFESDFIVSNKNSASNALGIAH